MKKRIVALVLSLLMCTSLIVCASAQSTDFTSVDRTLPLVVDNADILTDEEEDYFNEELEAFANKYQSEIAILTVSDLGGISPRVYADDFYDYCGYGYGLDDDGMLVLYKPGAEGEREIYITTHGTGISDYYADDIIDAMVDYLITEDYVGAFNTYIREAEKSHKFTVEPTWIIISIALGMIVGFAVPVIMASGNKSVRPQRNASVYAKTGSVVITRKSDVFVSSSVTKVPKPKNNSSSGSGTHRSSSGRSHGGGGRRF